MKKIIRYKMKNPSKSCFHMGLKLKNPKNKKVSKINFEEMAINNF